MKLVPWDPSMALEPRYRADDWSTASSAEEAQMQVDMWRRYQRAAAGNPDLNPNLIAALQPGFEPDRYTARDIQLIIDEANKSWDPAFGMAALGYKWPSALPPSVTVVGTSMPAVYGPGGHEVNRQVTDYVPPPGPPDVGSGDPLEAGSGPIAPPPMNQWVAADPVLPHWLTGEAGSNATESAAPWIEPMFQLKVGDVINPPDYPQLPPPNAAGTYPIGVTPMLPAQMSNLLAGGGSSFFNPVNVGGAVGQIGAGLCDYAPAGPLRTACLVANGLLAEAIGGESKGTNLGATGTFAPGCPQGYTQDSSGRCIQAGLGGLAARVLPGGSAGALTSSFGAAVMGGFGIPALQPAQVGTITRNDGSSGPILRCPAGMVLGKDQLCYMKGSIPRGARKNPPQPRPLLSAADGRVLNRAKAVEKRVRSVYSKHAKKPCRCGTAKRKK